MKHKIVSENCVNSRWKARFLASNDEECCQCSVGACKVRVSVEQNGHAPYTYVLTEQELQQIKESK